MSLLHDAFNARNLHLFQRLVDTSNAADKSASVSSTSVGKVSKHSSLGNIDVNQRDWLGRTVLHLASAAIEHLDYVRILLKHPAISVNAADTESHWTPLHRSLYSANLPAARLLLQRPDIDIFLKDNEGYTAFDLYNSTLVGTKPSPEETGGYADLYTWGTNVNAALGLGDSNDRAYPELVVFPRREDEADLERQTLSARFLPIKAEHVEMSKLHTVVSTSETGGNLRVCGFGSGGRLGPNSHTQYLLKSLSQLTQVITAIALGQDHTLALTKAGEVLSWGLNRFSQLGYPVDPPTSGRLEEPIQYSPRRVQGPLKKEVVKGVAASKVASACWTDDSVYTWGTNNGQLGYDKAAQPVQVQPRKVSRLTVSVISIVMSENVMACLMQNRQVECFYDDGHHRINFPTLAFPSPIRPYRPPQAAKDSRMAKITCCGDVFAALTSHGEVYIFSPSSSHSANSIPSSSSSANLSTSFNDSEVPTRMGGPFKCQRVWALRKKFSAVKDVALGADGSIIICTESGHVYVRTRNVKMSSVGGSGSSSSQKAFKFVKVPGLQRVTRVCASASGAFGALRVEYRMKNVEVKGNFVAQDLSRVRPWLESGKDDASLDTRVMESDDEGEDSGRDKEENAISFFGYGHESDNEDAEGRGEDDAIVNDIRFLKEMCDAIKREDKRKKDGRRLEHMHLRHGADTLLVLSSFNIVFPVHRAILGARSKVLCGISRSAFYRLYNDILPILSRYADRDPTRISTSIINSYAKGLKIKMDPGLIKNELQVLGRMLDLSEMLKVLERPVKSDVRPTLVRDLSELFDIVNLERDDDDDEGGVEKVPRALCEDVILELADREVFTHSVILRSRSNLFKSFFDEPVWTLNRWETEGIDYVEGEHGILRIDLKHLKWRVMEFVLKFMCCGCDKELFERAEFIDGVDDLVEFMFEVMAAANELLVDRLVLLCSEVILTYTSLHNACYVLYLATYYSATQLIDRVQSFITANMELFLQSYMLDDIPLDLLTQLSNYAQEKQKEKAPFVRGGVLEEGVMEKWRKWVEDLDVPIPIVRSNKPWKEKKGLPLPDFGKDKRGGREKGLRRPPSGDDIFIMDDTDLLSPQLGSSSTPGPAWKVYVAPKVDMKSVMAEAAASQIKPSKSKEPLRTPSKSQLVPRSPPQTASNVGSTSSPQRVVRTSSYPGSPPTPSFPPLTPQKQKEGVVRQQQQQNVTPTKQGGSSLGNVLGVAGGSVMGPTITPVRMPAGNVKSGQRSVSGPSKAWAYTRPIDPIPPPVLISPTPTPSEPSSSTLKTTTKSFLAIQQEEEEQQQQFGDLQRGDKRSLLDIQEEERARRQEEEFLKWWEEEEVRVKMEMEVAQSSGSGKSKRGGRKGGGEKGERRGGGGGSEGSGRGGPKGRKEGRKVQKNPGDNNATPPSTSSTRPPPRNHRKNAAQGQEPILPMSSGS
ncbi:hypothetical protein Agabi119p4_6841 [Agaricus bisporus var. burnettii]|uniref:BTB domain-containing protein n=1 Tax=Agaricus bisporus var. burnettii TaxID=192524 RepID=A0A8H7KCT9_AGABI|nr:hypothetical protein Agabi119p4_6841 [Agaricus bisporus var. burnettii]